MNKKGFSLLEVIVAMLILSIAIAGGMSLMVTCNRFILISKQRYQAVSQTHAMLERLRYYVSADPIVYNVFNNGQHPATDINLTQTPNIEGAGNPIWNYEVVDVGGTSRCKRVEATIQWM